MVFENFILSNQKNVIICVLAKIPKMISLNGVTFF